jgi:hypothetical protein
MPPHDPRVLTREDLDRDLGRIERRITDLCADQDHMHRRMQEMADKLQAHLLQTALNQLSNQNALLDMSRTVDPIRKIVYGLAGLILTGFVLALISLVWAKG